MKKHSFSPETQMMGYGYKPQLSEGAVKCPVFHTSTFVFKKAQDGKDFFAMAYGKAPYDQKHMGLIYSRLNNPDMEILEDRLKLWDEGEAAAVFSSGMSAITTTFMTYLKPGDVLLFSNPLYGGTHEFIHHVLDQYGITGIGFRPDDREDEIVELLDQHSAGGKLKMIFIETPANPTNDVIDIEMCSRLAARYSTTDRKVMLAVDNTYMGP
ncbi:MAG TPA: aminotransferase class I/II-fold pyridoxal phosphate-dependent enzyme, partial [Chitinophagaceae bacterium]